MDLRDIRELLLDMTKYIIAIFVLMFIVVNIFTVQSIVGPSMEPGLKESDILFLSKFHYKIFDIKRNDIVSFSDRSSKYMVKRIIGLPGEHLAYIDGKLYINHIEQADDFSNSTDDFSIEEIPEDEYFVLGDNRNDSLDGRDFGTIKKSQIIGKPYFKIWPIWQFKFIK